MLDADVLRAWAAGARTALALARPAVDAVNVFPVADADTGTNALLTVSGGSEAVAALPDGTDAAGVARAFARGALLAARGNSGVILSQYLAGFADGLRGPAASDALHDAPADGVVRALTSAARAARAAVAVPVEGTILTLADGVAARAASLGGPDVAPGPLLDAVLDDARRALDPISAEHPVLRREHVPDAGACALLVVLDALHRAVTGQPEPATPAPWLPPVEHHAHAAHEGSGTYEVMLVVRGDGERDLAAPLQACLSAVGDSVAVVGGDGVWHVHVHTDHPDAAIDAAALGAREQVVVRLVDAPHGPSAGEHDARTERWGLVACTASPALAAWYAAAGAVVLVVPPGAPVTATHVARAVADTGASDVALLPGGVVPADALDERPGPVVEVLDADDELRVVVAVLAAAASGSGSAAGVHDAVRALGRLRVVRVDDAGALPSALADVAAGAGSAGNESLTVLHRDPLDDATAAHVDAASAAHGLEPVLVGPTGTGAPFWLGVD